MKWPASWVLGGALLALAAAVLLGRPLLQPVAGALTSPAGGVGGLSSPLAGASPTAAAPPRTAARTTASAAAVPATPTAAPTAAPKLPFSYVGHWTGGGRTRVVLQRDGIPVTVQGPGPLDENYDVQAVNARQLTLLHRASGTRHTLDFDAAGSVTSTLAGGAPRGLQQAPPVAAVPPAHAPANSQGDTEDQQEGN
jgi:YD repeat-containing protein